MTSLGRKSKKVERHVYVELMHFPAQQKQYSIVKQLCICVWVCVCESVCECVSVCFTQSFDSLWPLGLQPARLLHPWYSPGKNTGVGCYALLQGIFTTQKSNQSSTLQVDSLPSEPKQPYSHNKRKRLIFFLEVLGSDWILELQGSIRMGCVFTI